MRFSEREKRERAGEQIQMRVTRFEKQRWSQMAQRRGVTLTELIRLAMMEEESRCQG